MEAMAIFKPLCASLTTNRTPLSPRATRPRRKASQKAPLSLGPTSSPSTSRSPAGGHSDGNHDGLRDHAAVISHFDKGSVQPDIGVRTGQLARSEAFDFFVQL